MLHLPPTQIGTGTAGGKSHANSKATSRDGTAAFFVISVLHHTLQYFHHVLHNIVNKLIQSYKTSEVQSLNNYEINTPFSNSEKTFKRPCRTELHKQTANVPGKKKNFTCQICMYPLCMLPPSGSEYQGKQKGGTKLHTLQPLSFSALLFSGRFHCIGFIQNATLLYSSSLSLFTAIGGKEARKEKMCTCKDSSKE